MNNKLCKLGVVVVSMVTLLGLAGCVPPGGSDPVFIPGQLNGGGSLYKEVNGTLDGTRATFTFNGSSCSSPAGGHFNFIDKSPAAVTFAGNKNGVMADGDVTAVSLCGDGFPTWNGTGCTLEGAAGECPAGAIMLSFNYRNKNAKVAGNGGTGGACVVDNGEGKNAPGPDRAAIAFNSPGSAYNGYSAQGIVGGNAQISGCD